MSANLTFDEHIRQITSKARQIMGIVLRSFRSRKTEVMLPLLKSLIRCKVEYACPIWSPTDSDNIHLLEGIQRTFTSKFQRFRTYDEELGIHLQCTIPRATESLETSESTEKEGKVHNNLYAEDQTTSPKPRV